LKLSGGEMKGGQSPLRRRQRTHPLSIGTAQRVTGALGLRPSDLLTDDEPARDGPQDATIVSAVLATHTQGLTDDVLARALGWGNERGAAIETLTEQLHSAGLDGQTCRRRHAPAASAATHAR
jgi:hypothetical protein